MQRLIAVLALVLAACSASPENAPVGKAPDRPQIILDTDFGGDADDLGAIAMLHRYADLEQIELLAIVLWSHEEYAVPALLGVNSYYGRPALPIGVREVDAWRTDWNHTKPLADQFPADPDTAATPADAVPLYRQILANSEDHAITLVTVGPLANIANLLRSEGDAISPLTGAELVDAKVGTLVIMGGQFPEGITANGPEWNFDGNMPGVTQFVLENVKRPIVFSGYELGEAIKVGAELNDEPADAPLYVGYRYFSEHAPWMEENFRGAILDNSSFDQTAVMYAAIGGVGEHWTLSAPGTLRADAQGVATWQEDADGKHRYLIAGDNVEHTCETILRTMLHRPLAN